MGPLVFWRTTSPFPAPDLSMVITCKKTNFITFRNNLTLFGKGCDTRSFSSSLVRLLLLNRVNEEERLGARGTAVLPLGTGSR